MKQSEFLNAYLELKLYKFKTYLGSVSRYLQNKRLTTLPYMEEIVYDTKRISRPHTSV